MNFHLGRLIDHVQLVVDDLGASKRFYRAVLQSLGRDLTGEGDDYFVVDELFVSEAEDGHSLSHIHLAFQSPDRETVHRFHTAALAGGGRNNGAPGERHYHPGYYAAFVLDPDGNNIEVVHHGPAQRSAASVVVTPGE
jgi:catechol 2,3-dioxygenase-like lactoylglutathione lyase family enzyme